MAVDEMVGGSADHWLHEKTTVGGRLHREVAQNSGSKGRDRTPGLTMTNCTRFNANENFWGGGGEDFGMGIGDLGVAWVRKWGMGRESFRAKRADGWPDGNEMA
ncbi:hypothetical protein OsJ_24098 [Oryza sativa Japonica Group]|uniref:Uncharacterized protein n=1 Tax=Oryza sativa subsp. japonica TaxID=39947 RepID=A3BJC9_ORYSJ|nr:hypothetical protein OsJ_24098 [Oryza sativa Japonica Group]